MARVMLAAAFALAAWGAAARGPALQQRDFAYEVELALVTDTATSAKMGAWAEVGALAASNADSAASAFLARPRAPHFVRAAARARTRVADAPRGLGG
jgi:hypothetical protein